VEVPICPLQDLRMYCHPQKAITITPRLKSFSAIVNADSLRS
jgi:hypothetical protein